jgi:hypothetical protein
MGRRPKGADLVGGGVPAHAADQRDHDELDANERRAGRSNDDVEALPGGQLRTGEVSHGTSISTLMASRWFIAR